jgi:dethiobiotin synthase
MEGVFVVGTDTDVGKTTLSGGLLKLMQGSRPVRYWKPVQTGTIVGDDTNDLKAMCELGPEYFLEPLYRFPEPLSPHMAARKWGKTIELDTILAAWRDASKDKRHFTIVEGAGGVMVPLNEERLQLEVIRNVNLPTIVVAEDRVGAINHTLLTLKALQDSKISILGVVIMKSRGGLGNAESIQQFGKVEVLAEFPPTEDVRSLLALVGGHARLREVFKVPRLP